MTNTDSSAAKV